jgi:CheY-like chemotaxis protein
MRLSPEERCTAVMCMIGHILPELWKKQLEEPVPDHIKELVARLPDHAPPLWRSRRGDERPSEASSVKLVGQKAVRGRASRQDTPSPDEVKVLVAEDEVLIRLMLADALRREGLQVFEAADADDAIAILRTVRVDVVITDLHMRTRNDGMLVAKYVHEHSPSTPVLLAAATKPASGWPFDAYFIKPYHPEDIASWIKRQAITPGQPARVSA